MKMSRVVAIVVCPRCKRELVGRKALCTSLHLPHKPYYVPTHKLQVDHRVIRCPGSTTRTTRLRWEER